MRNEIVVVGLAYGAAQNPAFEAGIGICLLEITREQELIDRAG